MEIGKQIKKYRSELSLSQDALAEKVYVSRQTISNWVSEAEQFYKKAVGAQYIKGGNPENSVYSNLVFMD